jgi:hypothetical protein
MQRIEPPAAALRLRTDALATVSRGGGIVPTKRLPTSARALIEFASIVVASLAACILVGTLVTWWLGAPVLVVWLFIAAATFAAFRSTPSEPGERIATLDARTEPELFALFDDVCAQMAMPKVTQIDVIEDVNAYVWYPDGKHPRIGIGASLFATLNRTEMIAVLAHELGHAHAGDGRSFDDKCTRLLARLSLCMGPAHPLKSWAHRRFLVVHKERLPMKRRHELRADGWSAFVAGEGAVASSGRALARCAVVFQSLRSQLADVAQADRVAVDDLFPLVRTAWTRAGDAALDALVRGFGGDDEDPDDEHPAEAVRARHADSNVRHIGKRAPTVDDPIRNWLARPEETERAWTRTLSERWASGADPDLTALLDDAQRGSVSTEKAPLKRIAPHLALLRCYALQGQRAEDALLARVNNVALFDLPLGARLKMVRLALPHRGGAPVEKREWLVPMKIGARTTTTTIQSFKLTLDEAAGIIAGLLFGAVVKDTLYGKLELGMPARVWLGKTWYTVSFLAAELATGSAEHWGLLLDEVDRYERAEKTDPNARALLPEWNARTTARARTRAPVRTPQRNATEELAATS